MIHYAVLSLATVTIIVLSVAVWRKTRQVAFIVGFAFAYYWTLYGAWLIVNRGLGYGSGYRFEYLFYKMFPIYLDDDYLWSLILYTLYIVTIQITVLHVASRPPLPKGLPPPLIAVSHGKIIAVSTLFVIGSAAIVRNVITSSLASGATAYRADVSLFSVYQILHEAALVTTMTGLAVFVSGTKARYVSGRSRPAALIGYTVPFAGVLALSVLMGNRSMLMFGAVTAGLFYLANTYRPNKVMLASAALLAVTAMALIGVIRGAGGLRELSGEDALGKIQYVAAEALSQQVESFASHASMYGSLRYHVSLTYGSSLIWLMQSVIPGPIRPVPVEDIYAHYAAGVGASPNQGFTIHHATGWYLNFGIPGIVIGAVVYGWIWATLFNNFCEIDRKRSHFSRVFAAVGFWNFTAYAPIVLRSGPETYKGVAVESLIVPALIMVVASMTLIKRGNRPRLVPARTAARWSYV